MKLAFFQKLFSFLFLGTAVTLAQESRKYQFVVPPLEIFDQLRELKMDSPDNFSRLERELLERRWRATNLSAKDAIVLDTRELLDAMIFASGVDSEKQYAEIRNRYEELEQSAKSKLQFSDPKKQADALLRELHQTAMKGGYDLECSSLAEIFANGKFNCVSSTSLYFLLGTNLGLKLQPISIPGSEYQVGHATLDLIVDKQRVQIEPTNADGFEWDIKLAQPGVISFNFGPPRNSGSDVDAWELAGMIYSNRANKMKSNDQAAKSTAVRNYLAALCLSQTSETPNRNLIATFTNWGPELSKAKRHDEAIRIMEFAHRVTSNDQKIGNNRRMAWVEKIQHLIDEKQDLLAVATIAEAAKAIPEESDFKSATTWFEVASEKAFKTGSLNQALLIVDRAMKVLPSQQDTLIQHRTSLVRRQSQRDLEHGNFEASLEVLLRFAPKPEDREMGASIAYHTQEALLSAYSKGGSQLVLKHIGDLREKLPRFDELQKQFESFVRQLVEPFAEKGQYDHAFDSVEELKTVFRDEVAFQHQRGILYVIWGERLEKEKGFEQAYAKLLEGMKACQNNKLLSEHAENCVTRWGSDHLKKKQWSDAIKTYEFGLKTFPNSSIMKNNIEYCKQEMGK
jgi:tetratricopeptide (TPR) repeat protein